MYGPNFLCSARPMKSMNILYNVKPQGGSLMNSVIRFCFYSDW